jgi:hypothetical protein
MPKIPAGKFWITSVPVGLEVYLGAKPVGKPVGRTPILLDAKRVGTEVTVRLSKAEESKIPIQEDLVEFTSQTTHGELTQDEKTGARSPVAVSLTYGVVPARKQTLIALFQPKSASLKDWARRYPSGRNFSFREEQVRKDLKTRGVAPVFFDVGIDLLRRGGKVGLVGKDGWVIYEVLSNGAVRMVGQNP